METKPPGNADKDPQGNPPGTVQTVFSFAPNEVLDKEDPGDATLRNFRYQSAYVVILLIAAALGRLPYVAIWCEHHEDILAERPDGAWDGYQVKSRQRESGDWTLSDDEIRKAIKTLTRLDQRFPNRIASLYIVSNARFCDTEADAEKRKSLIQLLRSVRAASTIKNVASPFNTVLTELATKTGHSPEAVFAALKKLDIRQGPQRESFDAEISHNHVSHLPGCEALSRPRLNAIRDLLITQAYKASSLASDDPSRHWCCVLGEDKNHPQLAAKRLAVPDIVALVADAHLNPFRYLAGSSTLPLGKSGAKVPVLVAKLAAAGLQSQVETFKMRMLSTESRLLEVAAAFPERTQALLDQLENTVKAEYAEALLNAERFPTPFGQPLLADVYNRLRAVARERPELIQSEPYEVLAGVAAMLTAECHFWWGPSFDLGTAA